MSKWREALPWRVYYSAPGSEGDVFVCSFMSEADARAEARRLNATLPPARRPPFALYYASQRAASGGIPEWISDILGMEAVHDASQLRGGEPRYKRRKKRA
jgi:hypothetical protein